MNVELITYDGQIYRTPTILSWRLKRTGQVPCDDMEMTCVYDGKLMEVLSRACRFRAEDQGETLLRGVVDEYQVEVSGDGMLLTVSGRGMAALLLDNEAEAVTYQDATIDDILANHVTPWGVTCGEVTSMQCGDLYRVQSGSSQWKAITGFTRYVGGFDPYFTADGLLVVKPLEGSGERLRIDGNTPVLSCRKMEKRYGVISEVLVKDRSQNKEQLVRNQAFYDRGGRRRHVLYMPRKSTYAAMRYTGMYQIQQSQEGSQEIQIELSGGFAAQPGDVVELYYPPLNLAGLCDVVEAESRGTDQGVTTLLRMEER